jgi:multidrug transporter EmrE-like cation transporter
MFILLAAMSGLMFTGGDVVLKYWTLSGAYSLMGLGLVAYTLGGGFLAGAMMRNQMALAVALLLCFNLITVALAGWWLFGETPGLKETVGMGLALGAIVLINV